MINNKHSLLSPSSSHRWLKCTKSVRLEERLPDTISSYAAEGILAHKIAEIKLTKNFIGGLDEDICDGIIMKLQKDPLYDPDMLKHTDFYLDRVYDVINDYKFVHYIDAEKEVDFSKYVPEGHGTVDCFIIGDSSLHVIDFKYGRWVSVQAMNNSQMMLYALGAYMGYSFLRPIDYVKMLIIQPRLNRVEDWRMDVCDLLEWAEKVLKPAAQKAFNGEGDFVSGEHCRFCKAKSLCRAKSEFANP